jgi:hypothetical protein
MAEICPVCNKPVGIMTLETVDEIVIHVACKGEFHQNPEKYGGTVKTEPLTKEEKEAVEQRNQRRKEQQQKIEDQSVYVKGFSMPFGEMVEFMVKWAIASIPAFIILFIIFGIFFAMFGAMFF